MDGTKNRKALLIALAVLAGIVTVTVAAALLMRGRGGTRHSSGDGVLYPYSWTEKKDGTIVLSLRVGSAANAAWDIGSADGGLFEISVGETKQGSTGVTLKPVAEGRETVAFSLNGDGVRLAEASFTVESDRTEDGHYAATISAHSERTFQSVVRGGEETGYPFTVRGGDEGLVIYVEDADSDTGGVMAWDSESSDSMVAAVSSIGVSDGGITIQLETRANGSAEVTVYSAARSISYAFDVEVRDGEIRLTDSRWEEYLTDGSDEADDTEDSAETGTENEVQP